METIRKTVESKYAPKQTNVIWVDTSGDTPVEKHFIKGKWIAVGGGGGGTTDYSELTDKPTINGVELDGNKTSSDLGVATSQQGAKADTAYQKPLSGIPESDLSSDVQSQLNKHFKGWYDSSSNLPANPVVGDYAYVKGAESTDPAAIYECTTAGTWSDSGRTADTSNVQTFASGEEVNEVSIVDDFSTGGSSNVASAETMKTLGEEVYGYEEDGGSNVYGTWIEGKFTYTNKEPGTDDTVREGTNATYSTMHFNVSAGTKVFWKAKNYEGSSGNAKAAAFIGGGKMQWKLGYDPTTGESSFTPTSGGTEYSGEYVAPVDGVFILNTRPAETENCYAYYKPTIHVDGLKDKMENLEDGLEEVEGSMLTQSDIADNLDTNDATKALSAKQGKLLNDKIFGDEVEIEEWEDITMSGENPDFDSTTPYFGGRWVINQNINPNKWRVSYANTSAKVINVSDIDTISIGATAACNYALLKSLPDFPNSNANDWIATDAAIPAYSDDASYNHLMSLSANEEKTISIPSDATYIWFVINLGSNDTGLNPTGFYIKKPITKTIDSIYNGLNKTTAHVESIMGKDAAVIKAATLSDTQKMQIEDFPLHMKKGLAMSFYADVTTFSKLYIGKGYQRYMGEWLEIDGQNITLWWQQGNSFDSTRDKVGSPIPHGLTIGTFFKVTLSCNYEGKCQVILQTLGGYFKYVLNAWKYYGSYQPFALSDGSILANCVLTATNTDFRCAVWAFGDSYMGINANRWPGALKDFGYFNYLIDALAGRNTQNTYYDLERALKFGTPKYLLYCAGGNNYTDLSVAIAYFQNVINLCKEKGIEPILYTQPNTPSRNYDTMNAWVKNQSGCRYIDFAKAVGDPVYEQGVNHWYGAGTDHDYISNDNLHPSQIGAQAMATQVMVDFPEIMQYGLYADDTTLDDTTIDQ